MQKVIPVENRTEVTVGELFGNEIVAYKSRSSNKHGYAILSQLHHCKWGFVHLHYPATKPVFVENSFEEAVEKAAKNRDVRVFRTMDELIEAMYKKSF